MAKKHTFNTVVSSNRRITVPKQFSIGSVVRVTVETGKIVLDQVEQLKTRVNELEVKENLL